jgi:hypothetical protein
MRGRGYSTREKVRENPSSNVSSLCVERLYGVARGEMHVLCSRAFDISIFKKLYLSLLNQYLETLQNST